MFAKTIIDSDAFLDMPQSTQLLYFHLSMRADDDGFVNKPKTIMRMIGAKDDDLKLLILKKFIIPFESGVVVIKHWKIHNYIQSDRYKETNYKEEKALLELDENKAYRLLDTKCIQDVSSLETQVRLGKVSIGKDNILCSDEPHASIEELKEKVALPYNEIIDYLNQKAGTNFKSTTKKTQELIRARINEKFTLDDFKTVIDKKVAEWKDTEMAKYLRPETLFGTKFEGYLNQKTIRTHSRSGAANAGNFTQRQYTDADFENLYKEV